MRTGPGQDRAWAAVGFDLDGTLFDHRGSASVAVRDFLRVLGVEASAEAIDTWFALEATYFEHWRTGAISFAEQRRRRLGDFLRAVGHRVPRDLDAAFDLYLTNYRRAWRAYPDAAQTLRTLREQGVRIGVLTNGTELQQHAKLVATNLRPLIDAVCTSEGIGVAKPDTRAFQVLASRLGSSPAAMAFVGDDPDKDIAGARAAGIAAGLVRRDDSTPLGLLDALRSAAVR